MRHDFRAARCSRCDEYSIERTAVTAAEEEFLVLSDLSPGSAQKWIALAGAGSRCGIVDGTMHAIHLNPAARVDSGGGPFAVTGGKIVTPSPAATSALAAAWGNALGAYQAGVYEALAEKNMEPTLIVGASALNGAIIAGNPPTDRIAKQLRSFWAFAAQSAAHGLFLPLPVGNSSAPKEVATCSGVDKPSVPGRHHKSREGAQAVLRCCQQSADSHSLVWTFRAPARSGGPC